MRFFQGVHVLFERDPVLVLSQRAGYEPMIPIPSIHPLDSVHPFNGMRPPIQGFFYDEGVRHPLDIPSRNHDEMTTRSQHLSFYGVFFYFLTLTRITKHKGLAAHILLPSLVWAGIDFILDFLFNHPFQAIGHFLIIQH